MPHDLFGDVALRPQEVRSRRSPLVVASLTAHATAVTALVVMSIAVPDALPFPQDISAQDRPSPVVLVDIPLPKEPRPPDVSTPTRATDPVPRRDAASVTPLVGSKGVKPETGNEGGSGRSFAEPGPGDPAVIPGAGVVEPPPPPPPPASSTPVRLHGGIRPPHKVTDVAPVYPAIARQLGVTGVVILDATIDVHGVVQSARVLRSVPLLDEAAADAVRQWRFEPAQLNNQPIAVVMTVTIHFTLGRK